MQKSNVLNEKCSENYRFFFDKDLLKGKIALITGGGSGIGFSIAEVFLRHGCNVVIASRNLQRVQQAAVELSKVARPNTKCLGLQLDVRKPENVVKIYQTIGSEFRRLDILVNCAAGNFICPVTSLSPNAYKTVIEIDTMGTFLCSKYAYEHFFQKQNNGVILNVTATLDYRGTPFQAHAGSAKAAIDALTRHMSVEWGCSNVRVVGIAPGATDGTEGLRKLSNPKHLTMTKEMIPLGRLGTRIEVANGSLFLVSEAAAYITGTVLVSDGGHWLTSYAPLNAKL